MKEFVDYYELLEISSNATEEEIKRAFRKMSKKYHPDTDPTLSEEKRAEYEMKFNQLCEARSVLTDRLKRVGYDFKYRQRQRKLNFTNVYQDDGIEYEETSESEDLSEPWKESLKSRSSKEKEQQEATTAGQFTYLNEEKLYEISARRYEPRPKKKSGINIKKGVVRITDSFKEKLAQNQLLKKGKYSNGYALKDKIIVGTLVVAITGSAVAAMLFINNDEEDAIVAVTTSTDYDLENDATVETTAPAPTEMVEETTEPTEKKDDSITLYRVHRVVEGDILSQFSKDSNTTIAKLKEVNGTKSDYVVLGTDYIIPYIIEPEDLKFYTQTALYSPFITLEDFAKTYETNIATLEVLNPEAIEYNGSQYSATTDSLVVPSFVTKEEYEVLKAAEKIQQKVNTK